MYLIEPKRVLQIIKVGYDETPAPKDIPIDVVIWRLNEGDAAERNFRVVVRPDSFEAPEGIITGHHAEEAYTKMVALFRARHDWCLDSELILSSLGLLPDRVSEVVARPQDLL